MVSITAVEKLNRLSMLRELYACIEQLITRIYVTEQRVNLFENYW